MSAAEPDRGARRVVVVAGMHRAGTSVVARGLMALGLDMGEALMSADPRMNARGFFEDLDIVAMDDALLDAQGADWKSLALLDGVDWRAPGHAAARDAARRLLAAKLARTGRFAFKDPRVSRLLPFWRCVFDEARADDAYVIAVRHPRAVIDSLTARDDLDPRRSAWLWLTHLLCALRYTHGRPRVVVDYDRMLEAPHRELARIAHALALPPDALARAQADPFAREFVSGELRHAHYAADELPPGLPAGVAEAHALAQRLARDAASVSDADAIAGIDRLFDAHAAMSPLFAYAGSVERNADDVPRLARELAWARGALAQATTYNEDLKSAVQRKDEDLAAADAYQTDLLATLARKEGELVAAHALLDRMREKLVGRMLLRRIERKPR